MFDLPQPLGPTMPVMPGSTVTVVFSPNDLKPCRVIASRRMRDCYTRSAEPQNKNHQPWGAGGSPPPDVASPPGTRLLLEEVAEGALGVVGAGGGARGVPLDRHHQRGRGGLVSRALVGGAPDRGLRAIGTACGVAVGAPAACV